LKPEMVFEIYPRYPFGGVVFHSFLLCDGRFGINTEYAVVVVSVRKVSYVSNSRPAFLNLRLPSWEIPIFSLSTTEQSTFAHPWCLGRGQECKLCK
jgi:hypothetical protein